MQSLYSCSAVQKLIDQYMEQGGSMAEIEEGVLGYGKLLLFGNGHYIKSTVNYNRQYVQNFLKKLCIFTINK